MQFFRIQIIRKITQNFLLITFHFSNIIQSISLKIFFIPKIALS